MERVLISACLLGQPVRYNGGDKQCDDDVLLRWVREGRVVAVCPEVSGGLPVPRPPAEITDAAGGSKVLAGLARVLDDTGHDVSAHFLIGARHALECARVHSIRIAVLKEGSPSCGANFTYDGTFSSNRAPLPGVTAALLRQAGIKVFSEQQWTDADHLLMQLEAANAR